MQNNNDFKPYVPAEKVTPELTITSIVMGIILAVVFGAANASLGLRVGMTVSASIPAAVISMGVIRVLMKKSSPDNATEEEFEIAFKAFKEYYDIHNQDKTVPYDGMIELMKRLKLKGIKMAIVSNKVQEAVDVLKDKFFSDILEYALGDTPGMARKPEPDSCYKALELLGSSKEDTVYVGDSDVDILTAQNAGLDCIWLNMDGKKAPDNLTITFEAKSLPEIGEFLLNN